MWTIEECRSFFRKLFGIEFTDSELQAVWNHLSENNFTPLSRHGGNNIGFTPCAILDLISVAAQRAGLSLEDARFKKVREEILPTVVFALLLKHLGRGEYLIVSNDVPDVALVDFDRLSANHSHRRVNALPIEAVFISSNDVRDAAGDTSEEKIAKVIITKKFNKRYVKETILLASLTTPVANLDLQKLSILLAITQNPFHHVWIFIGLNTSSYVMALLTPTFESYQLDAARDLWPSLY